MMVRRSGWMGWTRPAWTPSERLGEHSIQILDELLGWDAAAIESLERAMASWECSEKIEVTGHWQTQLSILR